MALPPELSFTQIVGRFFRVTTDGLDVGAEPQVEPIVGLRVIFRPDLRSRRVSIAGATVPITVDVATIEVTTDAEGDIVSPDGAKGVTLISSDNAAVNPPLWTYTVTVAGENFTTTRRSFVAYEGQTLDLNTLVPVAAERGETLPGWLAAVAASGEAAIRAEAAADRAEAAEGGAGGIRDYVHTQSSPAATWDITHNLGFYPNITILDTAGTRVTGDYTYVSTNAVQLDFIAGFAGVAYLS